MRLSKGRENSYETKRIQTNVRREKQRYANIELYGTYKANDQKEQKHRKLGEIGMQSHKYRKKGVINQRTQKYTNINKQKLKQIEI